MKRRQILLATLGALGWSSGAAQAKLARVGMLSPRPLRQSAYAPSIVARLGELGYRDGATMRLEYRSADGFTERYARLARELLDAKCDVIVALGTEPAVPFRDAGYPSPLIFLALDADPLERKLVKSLRNTGVNATGVYKPEDALVGKRLELVREVNRNIRHVLVLADTATRTQVPAVREAAKRAGVGVTVIEFTKPPFDYEPAFAEAKKAQAGAAIFLSSPVFSTDRAAISVLQAKHQLPCIGSSTEVVEAGFLLGLNTDPIKMSRRAAELAVRVLKGAKPSEIPVEQADEFELAVNVKTAKALGVKIPESVLARMTRIVQ